MVQGSAVIHALIELLKFVAIDRVFKEISEVRKQREVVIDRIKAEEGLGVVRSDIKRLAVETDAGGFAAKVWIDKPEPINLSALNSS